MLTQDLLVAFPERVAAPTVDDRVATRVHVHEAIRLKLTRGKFTVKGTPLRSEDLRGFPLT